VTGVSRLPPRGTLPFLAALTVATVFTVPANARQPAPAPTTAAAARAAQWWLTAMNVPRAWRSAPGRGSRVTIAVLSTGVEAAHQDLAGSVTAGPDYGRSGRKAGGPFWGFEGTAVASLIAGHGHGAGAAAGITGIAPAARILSVRVTLEYDDPLNSDPAVTKRIPDAIAAGIRYAVGRDARVIALPLDPSALGPTVAGDPAAAGGSPAERAAVSYAQDHDIVLVAPAGDNGAGTGTVNYPAAYPGVVAVGATARSGQLAPFTSTQSYVALTAPGVGLTEAAPDRGYTSLASTDMSSAVTAGVAALIRDRFPRLTAAEVAQALERGTVARPGARPVPGAGRGALDASAALSAAAAIAAAHPASARIARPTPAQPAPRPAARPAAGLRATAPARDAGTLAGSLLRDAVIATCALIAALAAALAVISARRRRALAVRQPKPSARSRHGGSHARRPRVSITGPPAAAKPKTDPWGQALARSPAALEIMGPGTGGSAGTGGGSGGGTSGPRSGTRPRVVPMSPVGSLGPASRAQHKRKTTGKPPWEPASPPAASVSPLPGADDNPRPSPEAPLPPWEQVPGEFAAAPIPADLPDWRVSTGPMPVWNPLATTAPQPAAPNDEDERFR
jgi:subtilisin family serine protease